MKPQILNKNSLEIIVPEINCESIRFTRKGKVLIEMTDEQGAAQLAVFSQYFIRYDNWESCNDTTIFECRINPGYSIGFSYEEN